MRTIKFRGQNIKGEWHYGFLSYNKDVSSDYEWFISNKVGKPFAFGVIEKSIGQFTGLHDKNGKEIYEGDVFKSILNSLGNELINSKLVYEGLRWVLKDSSKNRNFEYLDYYEADTELEVIGNIYENRELLEK